MVPDTYLGVCGKKIDLAHYTQYGAYVQSIEAWNTLDSSAIGALRVRFNRGAPITFGNASLVVSNPVAGSVVLTKDGSPIPVLEVRMWHSMSVDAAGKPQLGALYIKTDYGAMRAGSKALDFNSPDKILEMDEINRNLGDLGSGLAIGMCDITLLYRCMNLIYLFTRGRGVTLPQSQGKGL